MDHVDAWLMSYADMITLLFIVVVIAIPVSMNTNKKPTEASYGEPEHPYYLSNHSGLLAVNSTYDEAYRSLVGTIIKNNADEDISIEKTRNSISLDISVPFIFENESADIRPEQITLLKSLVSSIKTNIPKESSIVVEGYMDDRPLENSVFANKWELSSMQAARIAGVLVESGIDSTKLRLTSYAGNAPIVPNLDNSGKPIEKNRLRNQRVVIKIEVPPPAKENLITQ